ncbi:MAG: Uma2 family endonuclease [Anaerolineae bacterium]|nr:Uma2 family endonuclease [Anaerolineae bacterium]
MFQRAETYYSPEEYLALEAEAEYRSEYYQGEIFAMTGGSANHNRIAKNFLIELEVAFGEKPCEAFINDMRLLVKPKGLYTYPDVMVICGNIEFVEGRDDTVTNPVVIIEVLSKSTEGYDRGVKFELYRALTSLQDYILIDQAKIHVEHFHKLDDGRWVLQEFNSLENSLPIKTIEVSIPLKRIYHKVTW